MQTIENFRDCTSNGKRILLRTIPRITACRPNDPFKHWPKKTLKSSECGRQT